MYLRNLFAETRDVSPDERERLVSRFVAGLAQSMSRRELSWDEARQVLVPVLRGAMGLLPALPAGRELVPCLNVHVVVDEPDSMAYVQQKELDRWGVTFDEALAAACDHLAPAAGTGISLYDEALRIWDVSPDDDYDPSRLLLPGFLAGFADKVDGRPIAIAPARNMLLIAGDANPDTVIRLCDMAEREYAASPRPVSAAVYTYADDALLVPYLRAQPDAAARRVQESHVRFTGTEYSRQKQDLERDFEEKGIDRFVASFSGIDDKTEGLLSYCTWAFDVDGLLPVTDLVALDVEGEVALVPWGEVMATAGDCLTREPGLFPTRWRTVGTPTAGQLAKLGAKKKVFAAG